MGTLVLPENDLDLIIDKIDLETKVRRKILTILRAGYCPSCSKKGKIRAENLGSNAAPVSVTHYTCTNCDYEDEEIIYD